MKLVSLFLLAFAVGCTPLQEQAIAGGAAQLADQTLDKAIYVKCYAASIGSIQRRYGKTPHLWSQECLDDQNGVLGQ